MRSKILDTLYETSMSSTIEDMIIKDFKKCKSDEDFYKTYNRYIPFLWVESSIYTVRDRYSNVKNLVKDSRFSKAKKELLLNNVLVFDEKIYDVLNEASKNREDKKEVKEFSIDDYFKTIELLKNKIQNKDFQVLNGQTEKSVLANLSMFYLAFVTGRRFYELIKTLNIVKRGGKVYFDGLAKKRDEKDDIKLGFVLDDDYSFVKKALKNIRNYYGDIVEDVDSKSINAKYSKNISRALKKYVDATFHQIREQYAEVCEEKYNKGMIDKDLFKAFVLGHEVNVDATQFYKGAKAKWEFRL